MARFLKKSNCATKMFNPSFLNGKPADVGMKSIPHFPIKSKKNQNYPKRHQIFGLILEVNLLPRTLNNRPSGHFAGDQTVVLCLT